jgi:hypothetical protein
MYLIINDSDKSVNWWGDEPPISKWVIEGKQTVIEITEDQIVRPEGNESNLSAFFWDEELQKLTLDASTISDQGPVYFVPDRELLEVVENQRALESAVSAAQTELYNKLVLRLAELFKDDSTINEILSDQIITVDEFATISEMLSGSTPTANT